MQLMTEFRSELSSLRPQQRTAGAQMNLRPEAASRHSGQDGPGRTSDRCLTGDDGGPVGFGTLEVMAKAMEASGRYRILRRLEPRTTIDVPDGTLTRRGIFLDVETTGLDPVTDEIVELAMLPFDYTDDGQIFAVHEPFDALRDPGRPIPPAVTALTGISDGMVARAAIDPAEVANFIRSAALLIAHNAEFDRPFCEKFCPDFATAAWACSWREIPWKEEGFEGARLSQLAAGHGLFFDGHRAVHDCRAGIEILGRPLPRSGRRALGALLESAGRPRWRLWAAGAPYGKRAILKGRGYRWSDGNDGRPKSWYSDVADDAIESELQYLRDEIYGRHVEIEPRRVTAFDRYSGRY
jgi:DNA polymerase-3 subunit epsilon